MPALTNAAIMKMADLLVKLSGSIPLNRHFTAKDKKVSLTKTLRGLYQLVESDAPDIEYVEFVFQTFLTLQTPAPPVICSGCAHLDDADDDGDNGEGITHNGKTYKVFPTSQ